MYKKPVIRRKSPNNIFKSINTKSIVINPPNPISNCLDIINQASDYLKQSNKSPKILCKISNNMGDSLYSIPILRHYRNKYPNSCITFLTERRYSNVHELRKDIDKLFLLPNKLSGETRLSLWNPIKNDKNIDIAIIPAINPFRSRFKDNDWCQNNIADQYFYNAKIESLQPIGGRQLSINVSDSDKEWISSSLKDFKVSKSIAIEYISYSSRPKWNMNKYIEFVKLANSNGYQCYSIAGQHEPQIPFTIDFRGITWRQTVALLSKMKYVIGCGSGISMLAAASDPQPKIIELDVPENVTLAICGFAPSINIHNPTPEAVMKTILDSH